jgi:small subunit ribosomal protein S7
MKIDKFKHSLIRKGKKQQAAKVYQTVLLRLKGSSKRNPIFKILKSLQPKIRLVDKKKGASTLKIPNLITSHQSFSLALRWFFRSVKERKEKTLEDRIFNELKETLEGKSRSLKKKEDYYKLAIHNRGFIRLLRKRRK